MPSVVETPVSVATVSVGVPGVAGAVVSVVTLAPVLKVQLDGSADQVALSVLYST